MAVGLVVLLLAAVKWCPAPQAPSTSSLLSALLVTAVVWQSAGRIHAVFQSTAAEWSFADTDHFRTIFKFSTGGGSFAGAVYFRATKMHSSRSKPHFTSSSGLRR